MPRTPLLLLALLDTDQLQLLNACRRLLLRLQCAAASALAPHVADAAEADDALLLHALLQLKVELLMRHARELSHTHSTHTSTRTSSLPHSFISHTLSHHTLPYIGISRSLALAHPACIRTRAARAHTHTRTRTHTRSAASHTLLHCTARNICTPTLKPQPHLAHTPPRTTRLWRRRTCRLKQRRVITHTLPERAVSPPSGLHDVYAQPQLCHKMCF